MEDSRSLKEKEIITRILSDDNIESLSKYLVVKGKEIQYGHKYHLRKWAAVLEKFDDLLNIWTCKIPLIDDIESSSSLLSSDNDNAKALICSILYFLTILLSSCEGKRYFNLFSHLSRLLKAIDIDILELTLMVLMYACCYKSKLTINDSENELRYNEDENWSNDWRKRNIDWKEVVEAPQYLCDDILTIFEGMSFLATDYNIADYINGRLPLGVSSIASEITLSYPSTNNNDNDNENNNVECILPLSDTDNNESKNEDNNDIKLRLKQIISDKSLSSSHSLSILSALRAADGLKGTLSQRIRVSRLKFLCLYMIIHLRIENGRLNSQFLAGGSFIKDVITFSDLASEVCSDMNIKGCIFSIAAVALNCTISLLENRRGKGVRDSGIAEDLGVLQQSDEGQHNSAWSSILFAANVQSHTFNSNSTNEEIEDIEDANHIVWSSLINQHEQLSPLAYYRLALDFLATVMSQRGHNDYAISDAPVIGSVINFVQNSIPSLESILSRFQGQPTKDIPREEAYLFGTIVQALACLKLCFRSDNRNTYPIAFRECEGLNSVVKIIEIFGSYDYSTITNLNLIAILETSVGIFAQNLNTSRRSARSPADSGIQVLYQTYFIKLCTFVFQTSLKDNEFLWIGLLRVIKYAISIEPSFLSQFLNSSYSHLLANAIRKDTGLVTFRGGIILPLGELICDLIITNEGQEFVRSNRLVQIIIESLVKTTSLHHESKDGLPPKKVAHMGKIVAEIMRNFDSIRSIIQNTIQTTVISVCNECQLQFSDLSRESLSGDKSKFFNDMNNPRMKALQKLTNICTFTENLMPDQNRRHYRDLQRDLLSDEMIKSLLNVYHCILPYSRQLFAQLALRSASAGTSINHYGYYPAAKALTAVIRIAADLVPHVTLPELLKCIDDTLGMISVNKREFSISSTSDQMLDMINLSVSEVIPKRRRSRGSSLGQQGANVLILGVLDFIPNKCFFDHDFDMNDSSNEIYIWKFLSNILTLEWLSLVLSFCLRTMQRNQGSNNWISGGKEVLRRLFAFYRSSLLEVCRFASTKWTPKPISDCRIKKTLVNSPVLAEFSSAEDNELEESRMRVPKQYLLRVVDMTEAIFYENFEMEKSKIVAHAEIGTTYVAFERMHNGQGTIRYRTAEGWISESRRDHHRDPIVEVIDIPTMDSGYLIFESNNPDLVALEAMTLRESASHAMGRVHATLKHVAVYLSRLLVGDSNGRSFNDLRASNISPIAPILSSSLTKIMSGLLSHPLDCLPDSAAPLSLGLFKANSQITEDFMKDEQVPEKQQTRRLSGAGKGKKLSSGGGPGSSSGKPPKPLEDDDESPLKESIEINQAALSLYQGTIMKQIFASVIEDRHGSVNTYLLRALISGGVFDSFMDILGIILATLYDAIDKLNDTKILSVEGRCALYALPHIFSILRKIVAHDALVNSPVNASMAGLSDYIGTFEMNDFIYNSFYPIGSRLLPIFQNHSLTEFPADIQQDWLYVITELTFNLQTTIMPPAGASETAENQIVRDELEPILQGAQHNISPRLVISSAQSTPAAPRNEFVADNSVVEYFTEMGFSLESVVLAMIQVQSNDNEIIMEHLTNNPPDTDDADLAAALQLSLSSGPEGEESSPSRAPQLIPSVHDGGESSSIAAVAAVDSSNVNADSTDTSIAPAGESIRLITEAPASILSPISSEGIMSPVLSLSSESRTPWNIPPPPSSLPRESSSENMFNFPPGDRDHRGGRRDGNNFRRDEGTPGVFDSHGPRARERDNLNRDSPSQSTGKAIVSIEESRKRNDRFQNLAKMFRASVVSNVIEISNHVGKTLEWQPCASSDSMQLVSKLVNFLVQMNEASLNPDEISKLMSMIIERLSEISDYSTNSFGPLFLLLSICRCASIHQLLEQCFPLDQKIISNLVCIILSRLKSSDLKPGNIIHGLPMSWFSVALLVLNELMLLPVADNNQLISENAISLLADKASGDTAKVICSTVNNIVQSKKSVSKVDYPVIYGAIMFILKSDNRLDAEQCQSLMLILSTLLDDQSFVPKFLEENGLVTLLSITVTKAPSMSNSFVSTMLFTKILHNCVDSKAELRFKIKTSIQNFLTGKGVFVPNSMNKTRRTLNYFLTKMAPLLMRYPVDFVTVFIATCTICSHQRKEDDKMEYYVKVNDKENLELFSSGLEDESEFESRLESIVSVLINFVAIDANRDGLLSQSDVLSALSDCIPYALKLSTTIAKATVLHTSQNIAEFLITTIFSKDCDDNGPEQMSSTMSFQSACRFLIMLNSHRGLSRKMVIGSVIKYLKIYSSQRANILEADRIKFLTRLSVLISHMTEVSSSSKNGLNSNPHLSVDTLQVLISSGICELLSKALISLTSSDSSKLIKEKDDAIKAVLVPLELITRPKLLPYINRLKERLNKKERVSFTNLTGDLKHQEEVDSTREIDSPRGIESNGDEIIAMQDIDGEVGRNNSNFHSVGLGTSDVMMEMVDVEEEDDDDEDDDDDDNDDDEGENNNHEDEQDDDDDDDDDDDEDDNDNDNENDEEDEDDDHNDENDEIQILEDFTNDPANYSEILEDLHNESNSQQYRSRDNNGQPSAYQLFMAAQSILGGEQQRSISEGVSNNFVTPPDQIRPPAFSFFASMPRPGGPFSFGPPSRNLHHGSNQIRGIPPRWPAMIDGLEINQSRNNDMDRWDYIANRVQTASASASDETYGIDAAIPVELVHGQRNISSLHPILIRADEVNGGSRNLRPLNPGAAAATGLLGSVPPPHIYNLMLESAAEDIMRGNSDGIPDHEWRREGPRNALLPGGIRAALGRSPPGFGNDNSVNDGSRVGIPANNQVSSNPHAALVEQVERVLASIAVPSQLQEVEQLWSTPSDTAALHSPSEPSIMVSSNDLLEEIPSPVPNDFRSVELPPDILSINSDDDDIPLSPSRARLSHNHRRQENESPSTLEASLSLIRQRLVPSGNRRNAVFSSDQIELASDGQAELPSVDQAELSPGDQAEVPPGDQAELSPGDQADVPPGDQAELSPGDQAELSPGDQAELPSVGQAAISSDGEAELPTEVNQNRIPCPPGYDESVFYALPDFMQQEIVDQQGNTSSNEQLQQLALAAGYDFDTLMSLPENIRQEILDQARRDQAAAAAPPTTSGAAAEDMDNASFLVSLPPNLREEVLLSADASFMATLPPQLQAEANLLRERSAIQFLNRENAARFGNDEDDEMANRDTSRPGDRWRIQGGNNRRAGVGSSASTNSVTGYMRIPCDDVDETLIPSELLPVTARLINRESLDNHAQHLLNKLFASMCKYPFFRDTILKIFTGLLSEEHDIVNSTISALMATSSNAKASSAVCGLFDNESKVGSQHPTLVCNRMNATTSSKSSIRFILALTILITSNQSVTYDFLRNRSERYGAFEIESLKRNENTEDDRKKLFASTSDNESSNSLLEIIIGLFAKRLWKDKASDLLVLSSFVTAVTEQLDNLKDESQSEEDNAAPPEQKGTISILIPRVILSKDSLSCLCDILISDSCTQTVFDNITLVISRLSKIKSNNVHLTNLIVDVAQDLAEQSEAKLNTFLKVLGSEIEKVGDSKVVKSSLPQIDAGGRQHERMLRVIQTLNSMTQKRKTNIVDVIPYENFSSVWNSLEMVMVRLHDFIEEDDETSIGSSRKPQAALSSILARLLPAIEAFFIINACDILSDKKSNEKDTSASNPSTEKSDANQKASTEDEAQSSSKPSIEEILHNATTNLVNPGEKYRQSEAYSIMNVPLFDNDTNSFDPTRLTKSRSIRLVLSGMSQSISSSRSQKLLQFVHAHKSILNLLISIRPQMLEGSLAPLIRVPQLRTYLLFENKRKYFFNELRSMERGRGNIHLNLRRDQIYLDSFHQLRMRTADEMRGSLRINFQGEEGVDAGGLTREWYVIISKEIFNANYGLFVSLDGGSTFQPSSFSGQWNNNHLDYFKFIGRVIGKAICDGHLMDAHFTRSFYKHVLGIPVDYTDIEATDPIYYKNLKLILTNPLTDMGLDLTFSAEENTFGENKVFDLIPNGRNIEVTDDTKHDYVRLVAHHLMTRAIRGQIESFLDGFYDLVPPELISIFTPTELELLICGLPDVNIEELRQYTEYRQYRENDPIIIWFWDILRSFTREEKALFLQFVTGTSKVPLGGFSQLQGMRGIQHFSIHRAYVDVGLLPTAHTCYNQLDLPCYASQDDLREKLLMAIKEGNEGFGFA